MSGFEIGGKRDEGRGGGPFPGPPRKAEKGKRLSSHLFFPAKDSFVFLLPVFFLEVVLLCALRMELRNAGK